LLASGIQKKTRPADICQNPLCPRQASAPSFRVGSGADSLAASTSDSVVNSTVHESPSFHLLPATTVPATDPVTAACAQSSSATARNAVGGS
jgi:hypothetical protein